MYKHTANNHNNVNNVIISRYKINFNKTTMLNQIIRNYLYEQNTHTINNA